MYLKQIQIINFKNYQQTELFFDQGITCLVGDNGAGKTNLLDAIHYLSMCRSYLNSIDRHNIRLNHTFFSISGTFHKQEKDYTIHCAFKLGEKKIVRQNKKEYEKLSDHIGLFPTVMISPYDKDLIAEGSELRRKWLNSIIAQSDKEYLYDLQRYNRILSQRNALLKNMLIDKSSMHEQLTLWNEQLANTGRKIYWVRHAFMQQFLPIFQNYYTQISRTSEQSSIEYRSQLDTTSFEELLEESLQKDIQTQYTNVGIHKDDLLFLIDGQAIKKFGSQGQQKTFVIALRLAQYEWLKQRLALCPILLLDDIFDKLDGKRVNRLIDLVASDLFQQVIITDTDEHRIAHIIRENQLKGHIYRIDGGESQRIDSILAQVNSI